MQYRERVDCFVNETLAKLREPSSTATTTEVSTRSTCVQEKKRKEYDVCVNGAPSLAMSTSPHGLLFVQSSYPLEVTSGPYSKRISPIYFFFTFISTASFCRTLCLLSTHPLHKQKGSNSRGREESNLKKMPRFGLYLFSILNGLWGKNSRLQNGWLARQPINFSPGHIVDCRWTLFFCSL